ncbi:MAG: chemotaxis protein CheX [Planctomycetota bacterium]
MADPNGPEGGLALRDEELLSALQGAMQEVFTTMVFTICESAVHEVEGTDPRERTSGIAVKDTDGDSVYTQFDIDAEVEFHGEINGWVVLRCSAEGAMDIARGLLMLEEGEALDVAEAADAIGECANMVTGVVKTKMLDPQGDFVIGCPKINIEQGDRDGLRAGTLAYRLTRGVVAVEIWMEDR